MHKDIITLKQITAPILEDIKIFQKEFENALDSEVRLINSISKYMIRNKGKNIRPILTILSARLCGKPTLNSYKAAAMMELLHVATLIHDDVVDDAHFRRGFFSVNNLWKNKLAVLVGDFLLSKGLALGLKNQDINILLYTSMAVEKISEGEIFQIQKSRDLDITEKDYFNIIQRKTGSLFGCCFQLAAVCNNISSKKQLRKLYNIGLKIGTIFQIKDDILDYKSSTFTGKKKGNDIKESKINLPLLYTIKKASFLERQEIFKILKKNKIKNEDILRIYQLVQKKKGIKLAIDKMENLEKEIISDLNIFPESENKTTLIDLIHFILVRKK